MKALSDRHLNFLRWGLIAVMSVYMISLAAGNICIWDDELFTLHLVDHPISQMWGPIIDDLVHPPLYYYSLKLFLYLFPKDHLSVIPAAKLFSVLWIILLMILGSRMIVKRFGTFSALLFVLLCAGNMTVGYSVEIRMYSMAMCFAGLNALFAERVSRTWETKDLAMLAGMTLFCAYTNYFALFSAAFLWLWLLYEAGKAGKLKAWILTALICFVLYLPWAVTVLLNRKPVADYAAEMSLARALSLFAFPFSCHNTTVSIMFMLFVLTLVGFILLSGKKDLFFLACLFNPILIGLTCIVLSFLFQKFVIGRYLLPGFAILWAGIAAGAAELKRKEIVLPMLAVLDIAMCFFIFQNEANDRIAARNMVAYFEQETAPVYAELGVRDMLVYLCGEREFSPSMEDNPSGRYYVYYWTDDWQRVRYKPRPAKFRLSAQSVEVHTD